MNLILNFCQYLVVFYISPWLTASMDTLTFIFSANFSGGQVFPPVEPGSHYGQLAAAAIKHKPASVLWTFLVGRSFGAGPVEPFNHICVSGVDLQLYVEVEEAAFSLQLWESAAI